MRGKGARGAVQRRASKRRQEEERQGVGIQAKSVGFRQSEAEVGVREERFVWFKDGGGRG